jgi:hypothetical protein
MVEIADVPVWTLGYVSVERQLSYITDTYHHFSKTSPSKGSSKVQKKEEYA